MLAPGWWAVPTLLAVGILVYANSLGGPFIYDDNHAIVENDHIRQLQPLSRALGGPPQSPVAGRPVISLSLALNYALGKMDDPADDTRLKLSGFHAFNIAVHVTGALVLFGIVRRTFLNESLRSRFGAASGPLALACALLWMVHPVQTECVNYITQRTESVMGLFYLLTLYGAIRAHESERPSGWYTASIAACALGMASKESMVTAPLVILIYDRVFLFHTLRDAVRRRRGLYLGLMASWVVLAALNWSEPRADTVGLSMGVSPWDYAKNQCWVIVHYLRLALWPDHLLLDYGFPEPVPLRRVLVHGLALIGLLALTLMGLVHRPKLGFLGAWFFITLGPTSSFVPITTEVGAERRMYLPLAGLVVLGVVVVYIILEHVRASVGRAATEPRPSGSGADVAGRPLPYGRGSVQGRHPPTRPVSRWLGGVLVAGVALALSVRTVVRNRDYHSAVSIWRSVVALRPDNWRAHNSLGEELHRAGKFEEALDHLQRAVKLRPNDALSRINLARVLQSQGRPEEALGHFRAAVAAEPKHLLARMRLGSALVGQNRTDEAMDHYRAALSIEPAYAMAHYNLGILLAQQGQLDQAIDHYRRALRSRPDYAEAHYELATALGQMGQLDEAIGHLRQAVSINPNYADAYYNLHLALNLVGRPGEALAAYREAVRLKPELAELAPAPAGPNGPGGSAP